MNQPADDHERTGLLVSVRSAEEALAALEGGADVIDVKEPNRGSLGAADTETIEAVVRAVNGRSRVTAAKGELRELASAELRPVRAGVSLFKIGLAGCRAVPDWRSQWREVVAALVGRSYREEPNAAQSAAATAVVYADWRSSGAPEPSDVLTAAVEVGASALLIDTFDKSRGTLFDYWPAADLRRYVETVRSQQLLVVLAGSLAEESLAVAASLGPHLVAVRAAACAGGRRGGTVAAPRVRALQAMLAATAPRSGGRMARPKNFLDNAREIRILEST